MKETTLSRAIRKGRRPDKAGFWVRPVGRIWASKQGTIIQAIQLAKRAARLLRDEIEILEIRGRKGNRHIERVTVRFTGEAVRA